MAIREKIEKVDVNTEKLREEMILRGGKVAADNESKKKEWVNFCLRIKVDMLHQVEEALEDRVGINKTGWMLEAIHEKLRRSKDEA